MAVMIEPRKEEEKDPDAGLGTRVSVLEVKLDALSTKVDEGFEQVDKRFEQVDKRFEQVDGELLEQRRELGAFRQEMSSRFDALQRTMVIAAVAMPGAIAVLVRLIS